MTNITDGWTMRLGLFAIGCVILFAGLILISASRNAFTVDEPSELIKVGEANSTEVNDVSLHEGNKFSLTYIGGGRYVSPDEVLVNVFDPLGNEKTFPYVSMQKGIRVNSTGLYKFQVGAPGIIDPNSPSLFIRVYEIKTHLEYPNSSLLPPGLVAALIGAGISIWAAKSKKRKLRQSRARK